MTGVSSDISRAYLLGSGDAASKKAANKAGATRDDLVTAAQSAYSSASKSGGTAYDSVTSYMAKQTSSVKDATFETWSNSELKSYLDSYGVPVPQGSKKNELVAYARNTANYFRYGMTLLIVFAHILTVCRHDHSSRYSVG